MNIKLHYDALREGEKRMMWDAYRSWLEQPDKRLVDPIGYSLWVDCFEDPDYVARAWPKCHHDSSQLGSHA